MSIGFILAACSTQTTTPSPLSAAVKELSGTVNIKQPGATDFAKATGDSVLQQNGSMQTGADGRVRLDLSTGTIIRMSPSSLFTLTANDQSNGSLSTKLNLDLGRIFIVLNGGSLEVKTPSGVASVRGSYMMVEVDPNTQDVYVTCLEGHCGAGNDAGNVDFTSGQKTILFHRDPATGQYTPPGVQPMTPEDYQKWLDENPEAKVIIDEANGTLTALAPTATFTPSPTATLTSTPTPTALTCVQIINPLDGSNLPKYGPINFEWSSFPGAAKYIVTFHYPNNVDGTFETFDSTLKRYAETMPAGGDYSWDVTVIGGDGSPVCKTNSVTFSKLVSQPDKPIVKPPTSTPVPPTPTPTPPQGG